MAVLSAPSCVCVRTASVRAFAHRRRLTIPHAWPTCERSLSCVRVACVRVFACVRCRMRGCLACALTYVRKRLACIRGHRHMCAHVCEPCRLSFMRAFPDFSPVPCRYINIKYL